MTNATTTAAAPPGNPGHGRRRWLSRRSRLVPLAAALTICPLALYAIARWDMVGLAFAVLVSGAVAISVGVWSMLGGPDTRRAVVGEVIVDVGVALVTGAALGLVLFAAQDRVEESRFRREQGLEAERAERDERRDNIRLVRELAAYPGTSKHFDGLDLRGAVLEALDLTGASFAGSDLRRARLSGATLTEAQFFSWGDHHEADAGYFDTARLVGGERANLSDATLDDSTLVRAHLVGANLRGASLTFANLTEADLSYADLTGADLSGARLENTILIEGTVLDDVVYDETTVWPEGFTPPS